MKEDLHGNSEGHESEHEQLIQRLLSDPAKMETVDWLKSERPDERRTVGACETNLESLEFVQKIYDLGASEILAVNIHPHPNGAGEHAGKLVVILPQNPGQRTAIFEWCRLQGDSLGFTPESDQGESHLFLLLD